jgi:hypothetical protein
MPGAGNQGQDRPAREPSYLDAVAPLIVLTVLVSVRWRCSASVR